MNTTIHPVALFWSGGKDSAFALYQLRRFHPELQVTCLITTLNTEYQRISMHGVREEMLDLQAEELGLPLLKMWVPNEPDNVIYGEKLDGILEGLKARGIFHVAYGDIFLEDLKQYRDTILNKHGLTGIYPLWKKPTAKLIDDFLGLGFRTVLCCVSSRFFGEEEAGQEITRDFIRSLPAEVDPCGENGEFHTFCFGGPVFKQPILFQRGEKVFRPLMIRQRSGEEQVFGFWYQDIVP